MKAVVFHGVGEPETVRVEDVAEPVAGPGEAVVRVHAAALNHRDLFIRRGQYAGLRFPVVPGSDGAGVVSALGAGVDRVAVGDRVVINPGLAWGDDPRIPAPTFHILGLPDDGTLADYVKTPASSLFPWPVGLSAAETAAIPLAGLTAYRAVATRGRAHAGETVVVLGVGGGVATFALLIARQLGARVFVTSGSEEKLERARALGAEGGVNYRGANWVKDLREMAGGGGPDLVIDGTGGTVFEQAIDLVRPGGRVVTYGSTLGAAPALQVRRIFFKQIDILGTTMGSSEDFSAMIDLFGEGKLRPVVDRVFPLGEIGAALVHMDGAAQFGKIVFTTL